MPDPRTGQQLLHVITRDGIYQYLSPFALDLLLGKNLVLKFKRSSGWVNVGTDPIRVKERRETSRPYLGPERRSFF